jgi:hypothetical protein
VQNYEQVWERKNEKGWEEVLKHIGKSAESYEGKLKAMKVS